MACMDENRVVEYVDAELPPHEREAVEAHLSDCADCRRLVAALARGPASGATSAPARLATGSITAVGGQPGEPGRDRAPLVAGDRVGRYEIIELLGRGGMGVVYRARDPELGRSVALKLVRARGLVTPGEEAATRLGREARALAQLAHPNVVAVHDLGLFAGGVYVAMEYVPGRNLREWLAEAPRGRTAILEALRAAGEGLAAAHTAGLVHRDVKPDNIVIGDDGRARMVDFGLVMLADGASDVEQTEPVDGGESALTLAGAIVGTPGFMAPEQHRGGPVDARSDQFGFCATACEALSGQRPMGGRTPSEIAGRLARGEVHVPDRVPKRVRRVLARGLERDPRRRYPDMPALLRDLATASRPPRWRRALVVASAAAGVFALAAILFGRSAARAPAPCTGARAELAGVWDGDVTRRTRAAFAAAGQPGAEAAFARVHAGLDRYARRWVDMRTQACRATRVLGTQSDRLLDTRMRCLDRRLQGVRGLVAVLTGPLDRDAVDAAATAVALLEPVDGCADDDALARVVALPADPVRRGELLALEPRLAGAAALYELGRYPAAGQEASRIVDGARRLDYPPLLGEALHLSGEVRLADGDLAGAEAALRDAVQAAARGRDDETEARAWITLLETLNESSRYADALGLAEVAHAAVVRAGAPAPLRVHLDLVVGDSHNWAGDEAEAVARLRRAVEVAEAELAPGDPLRPLALVSLAEILSEPAHAAEAVELAARGTVLAEAIHGDRHNEVVYAVMVRGRALRAAGRLDEARAEIERGIGLARQLSDRYPGLLYAYQDLGRTHLDAGRPALAEAAFATAAQLAEAIGGTTDLRLAGALRGSADARRRQGDLAGAQRDLERVVAIESARHGEDSAAAGTARIELGRVEAQRGDAAAAKRELERGLATLADAAGGDGHYKGLARAALARLWWRADRRRALALADAAEPDLIRAGLDAELSALRAWRRHVCPDGCPRQGAAHVR